MVNDSLNLHEAKLRTETYESPESRRERALVLAWVAERKIAADDDPQSRVDRLLQSEENFMGAIVNANRILTKTADDEFGTGYMVPYSNIILDENRLDYVQALPHPDDKHDLLLCLFDVARRMKISDRSAEHTAAVIGYGINLVHPFTYANGRTARIIHDSLINGTVDSEARYSQLSYDTYENTDSLNPTLIEPYIYSLMKQQYGSHTEQNDGALVPNTMFAMTRSTWEEIWSRTSDMSGTLNSPFDHTMIAISHPEISPILAHLLVHQFKTPATERVLASYNGQTVLNLDIFTKSASDSDWDTIHSVARRITAKYAVDAMHVLATDPKYGPEISGTINTKELGPIELPLSQTIQQLAQQKLHREPWLSEIIS